MTEDIAAKIRERLEQPSATPLLADAVRAVLDLCDRVSVDLWGEPNYAGRAIALSFREALAKALGISVSPLRGPTQDAQANPHAGSQPRSGDPTSGVLSEERDRAWTEAERSEH